MVKDRLVELQDKQDEPIDTKASKSSVPVIVTPRTMAKSSGYKRVEHPNDRELTVFLGKCESSTKKLHDLRSHVHNLSTLHDEILASTSLNDKKLMEKRQRMLDDVRKLTYEIRDDIYELKNDVLAIPGQQTEGTSARMAALHLQKLTADLNDVTHQGQAERTRFDDRVKARLRREYEIIGEYKTDSELNGLIERENFSTFTQMDEMHEARRMLDDTKQRQFEVLNLERSVIEVHELFLDINLLVKEQGETLTTIEGNVNATVLDIEAGGEQLKKADDYRKKVRRKKLCIAIVVTVAALVVVGIIVIALTAG